MFTIENQFVTATLQAKGAELTSLVHKSNGLDYMWNGDPAFWAKHAPVLFPIVGELKDKTFFHEGKSYHLPRHGFARDRQFVLEETNTDNITFLLSDDEETRKVYPFAFEFRIKYTLTGYAIAAAYEVINSGKTDMYFSVGGHPAFKVPLEKALSYTDYYLAFDKAETSARWPISPEGLIDKPAQPFLNNAKKLPLSKELFLKDAVVFKNLASSVMTLKSDHSEHGLQMDYPGFPYMGIWAAKNADFVCIEPWCGIADSVDATQQLAQKEGINRLQPGEAFDRTWTVTVF